MFYRDSVKQFVRTFAVLFREFCSVRGYHFTEFDVFRTSNGPFTAHEQLCFMSSNQNNSLAGIKSTNPQ